MYIIAEMKLQIKIYLVLQWNVDSGKDGKSLFMIHLGSKVIQSQSLSRSNKES